MKRLSKFILIGGIGFGTNLLLLYVLVSGFHLHYMISAILAGVMNTTANYLLNYYWTFSDKNLEKKIISSGFKFFIVTGFGLLLYLGLMYLFVGVGKINYMISSVVSTGISFIPRYLLCCVWVWNNKNRCVMKS
jgi:putative flippase GtrA